MADTDWAFLNDGLDAATVSRGVTAGIERPPGGGRFLYGFNSRAASPGAVAHMAGRRIFTNRSRHGSFEGRHSFALPAGHLDADGVRRRAILINVEDQAGGAGVVSVSMSQLFDGRRRWGSFFGIRLFSASAAEPAGLRAAGQQGELKQRP